MSRRSRNELLGELVSAVRAFQRASEDMDHAVMERLGVNRTDARCLDILDEQGPMTAGRLAEAAHLSTGAVTTVLDRLERAGHARRVRDEHDRRRVLAELTPEARRLIGELYGPLADLGEPMLSRYTIADLEVIVGFLRGGAEVNETRAAQVRAES